MAARSAQPSPEVVIDGMLITMIRISKLTVEIYYFRVQAGDHRRLRCKRVLPSRLVQRRGRDFEL